MRFSSQGPEVGYHSLLEGIFLTQGSNPRLSRLLHWKVDSLHLSHRERNLSLIPAMCPEGAVVPGVEIRQQDPLQSGSSLADKVLTQPRGTDNDSRRI